MSRITLELEVTAPRSYMLKVQYAIIEALTTAVDTTIAYGVLVAKKHAPVRKVTRLGRRPSTRALTTSEISELPESIRKALNPISGAFLRTGELPRTTVRRGGAAMFRPQLTRHGETRLLRQAEGTEARQITIDDSGRRTLVNNTEPALTGPGLRELRGRVRTETPKNPDAVFDRGGLATLGGRLRREIYGDGPTLSEGVITGHVISPTEYGPYVEWPTSRTAAQPYMRPAREAMKPVLVREAERELARPGAFR